MKEFVVDHEVVMEHTLSYLFGAKSIVKNISRVFDVAFLPAGYHFYTGILQAASYRGLKNKKKIILVFEGKSDDKIMLYNRSIGPFLGKKWDFDKKLKILENKFNFIEMCEYGIENINSQLNYLRILFDTKQIIPMFVGSKVSKIKFIKFIGEFDIKSDFNLVFVSDINLVNKDEKILINDKKEGTEQLNYSFVSDNVVFNMFSAYVKAKLLDVKILAQTDSYQVSGDYKDLAVYLSAVAK
ncbi:MAG: hypothetical protein WAZ12_02340 [Candidatus Absconditicoccaceae bacterium]